MEKKISRGPLFLAFFLFLLILPAPAARAEPVVDGTIGEGEYLADRILAGGRFRLAWQIVGERIFFGLSAETLGWVGLAIAPIVGLDDADLLLGWVDDNDVAWAVDGQSQGALGPLVPDTALGGSDDILQFAGRQDNGRTTIELVRLLDTGDPRDRPIGTGRSATQAIWLYGRTDRWRDGWAEQGSVWLRGGEEPRLALDQPMVLYILLLTAVFLVAGAAVFVRSARRAPSGRPWAGQWPALAALGLLLATLVFWLIRAGLL